MGKDTRVSVVVMIEKDGDSFHAYAPALKGLHVDGATEAEAVKNAEEAVGLYLESMVKHGETLPEGEGLVVHGRNRSFQHVTLRWPSPEQHGSSLETALPAN